MNKMLVDYNIDNAYDHYKGVTDPIDLNDDIRNYLDVRSVSALKSININLVGELLNLPYRKVAMLPNVGKKTACLIASLAQYANRMHTHMKEKAKENPVKDPVMSAQDVELAINCISKQLDSVTCELNEVKRERDFLKESLSRLLGI